ncbi:TadE/TadG family type IV pilus assembly protein [Paenibacillus silvisoli]|uniref:TadE/TadG family type IV pilus assembly protein n=1 Tax=Paenibacillus silvisoli TaxID=3110539 RepID=UPI002803B520|nr:pilus assembly protein [Paenibacillus silvisoli]
MKRRTPSAGHTDRRRGEAGSIVVEAALILPLVLMVIMFFICLIRLNLVQMALQNAVSQTVRQAAAAIRPIDLALQQTSSSSAQPVNAGNEQQPRTAINALRQLPGFDAVAGQLEEWLPSPAGPLLAAALQGDWQPVVDAAATEAGRHIVEPLLRHEADKAVLNPAQLRLSKLSLPDLKGRSEVMLQVEAEYEFKLAFPFTKKTLVLKESAAERVWVSDAVPARTDESAQDKAAPIQIVQLEPSPLNPGHRARVVVRTSPGRSVTIKVLYKSGQSTAKHLGDIVTDSEGYAEWTWLVSGNTTPGIWELIVASGDGASRSARHFVVEKRSSRDGGG